MAYMTPDLNI